MRMILILVACLGLAGCMKTAGGACAGWEKLNPASGTRNYIVANDKSFAREVASHNEFGQRQNCW